MSAFFRPLRHAIWRNRDFRLLWVGHTVSMFGSQITTLALPLTAALLLHATPQQMALLQALGYAPATLLGLFAGVWVDRLRRRPIMIAMDLARAGILVTLPLAAALGVLRMEVVYVLAVTLAGLGVFYGLADSALLPRLLGRDDLVRGWSALGASTSVARIAGPGIAGVLVQALSAPVAVLIDASTFIFSALMAVRIRTLESDPPRPRGRSNVWGEIGEGVQVVWSNAYLRIFQLTTVTFDVFWNALYAVYILYVTRTLALPPSAVGLIFGIGSVGALVGAVVTVRVTHYLGLGRTLILMQCILGLGSLLIALAMWLPALALPLLIGAEVIQSLVATIFGISRESVTQAVTPDRLRGRVGASIQCVGLGVATTGTLLGGWLGEHIGIPATLLIGVSGGMLSFLWLLHPRIRMLQNVPNAAAE